MAEGGVFLEKKKKRERKKRERGRKGSLNRSPGKGESRRGEKGERERAEESP
jgi:hypothetical protein